MHSGVTYLIPTVKHLALFRRRISNLIFRVLNTGSQRGENYPNWVMGPFDLGNGLFFSTSVSTITYFIERKLARKNRPNRRIKINDYSLSFCSILIGRETDKKLAFLSKILFVHDWGVTTQRRCAILGNRSKKVGNTASTVSFE